MNLGTAEFCKKYAENYKASNEAERVHCWQILSLFIIVHPQCKYHVSKWHWLSFMVD
jgi:hypothetical protein